MPDNGAFPFDDDAYRYLRNTLNEVVNGIRPTLSLETRIASVRPAASALLANWKRNQRGCYILPADASLLLETASICDEDFEDDEFSTRLGYTRAEAAHVMVELRKISEAAPQQVHAAAS